jgi:ABC-type multidrug transport system ATPase subunit
MPRVKFHQYSLAFGSRKIFDNVSVEFNWSENEASERIIGLMGPSGSGKTTLMRQILTARYIESIPGVEITPVDTVIGFVPQTPILFSNMDNFANARLFESMGHYKDRFDSNLFSQLSGLLRLDSVLRHGARPHNLSGGEMQRLMLLRTLSVRPDLLILDEPSSGLDPAVREDFLIDLIELIEKLKIGALYIGHHWDEISFVASRVAHLASRTNRQDSAVSHITLLERRTFESRPPTIDAFQSVYGPGCTIWPVYRSNAVYIPFAPDIVRTSSRELIACLPPPAHSREKLEFVRSDNYRISVSKNQSIVGDATNAFVYREGEFLEHSRLELDPTLFS